MGHLFRCFLFGALASLLVLVGCGGEGGSGAGGNTLNGVYRGTFTPAGGGPLDVLFEFVDGRGTVLIGDGGDAVFATVRDARLQGSIATVVLEAFSDGDVTEVTMTGTPFAFEITGTFAATTTAGTESGTFRIEYVGDNAPTNFAGVWRGSLTEGVGTVRGDAPVVPYVANLIQQRNSLSGTVVLTGAGEGGADVTAVVEGRAVLGSAVFRLVSGEGSMNWGVESEDAGATLSGTFKAFDITDKEVAAGTVEGHR